MRTKPRFGVSPRGGFWRYPQDLVLQVHAQHVAGKSLTAAAAVLGTDRKTLRDMFTVRGLSVRQTQPVHPYDKRTGCFLKRRRSTPAELEKIIAMIPRLSVPEELHWEWKVWTDEKRRWYVSRLRKRFPDPRPAGRFSSNVIPFDYFTPEARAIQERECRGHTSQTMPVKLKPASVGVIYDDKLWFWSGKAGYTRGPWRRGYGRPSLHHVIWIEANCARRVPEDHTVIFLDGNHNNFSPENLGLRSRADCARQNMMAWRTRNARASTALLLSRFEKRNGNDETQHHNQLQKLVGKRRRYYINA